MTVHRICRENDTKPVIFLSNDYTFSLILSDFAASDVLTTSFAESPNKSINALNY
jgi:hypothetical protein